MVAELSKQRFIMKFKSVSHIPHNYVLCIIIQPEIKFRLQNFTIQLKFVLKKAFWPLLIEIGSCKTSAFHHRRSYALFWLN